MIVRNRPFAFVRPKESSQPVSSPMQRRSNTDGTKFQYGWNQVPVWMEPSSSTDGTKFQYGWNETYPFSRKLRPLADFIFSLYLYPHLQSCTGRMVRPLARVNWLPNE